MTTTAYRPGDGLVMLELDHLVALLAHAHGTRADPAALARLTTAGVLVDGTVDSALAPAVATLCGNGPRLRLQTRGAGALVHTDAVTAGERAAARRAPSPTGDAPEADPPPTGDTPGDAAHPPGPAAHPGSDAVLLLPHPDAPAVHVHQMSRSALARFLARRMGVGDHLLTDRPVTAVELPHWRAVRRVFDTAAPDGWADGYRRGELHELRWAPAPGRPAGTAVALARLDRALAEITPADGDTGGYTVRPADGAAVWRRLCRLLASPPSPFRPAGRHPGAPAGTAP